MIRTMTTPMISFTQSTWDTLYADKIRQVYHGIGINHTSPSLEQVLGTWITITIHYTDIPHSRCADDVTTLVSGKYVLTKLIQLYQSQHWPQLHPSALVQVLIEPQGFSSTESAPYQAPNSYQQILLISTTELL